LVENRVVCDIMWKNIVEVDKPQMEIWKYVTYALIVGYLRLQTHARGTYCCSRLHNLWIRVGCLLSHFPALFA